MELEEQLLMQKWLYGLLTSMRAGEFNHVITELENALGRIEEDQDEHGIPTPDELRVMQQSVREARSPEQSNSIGGRIRSLMPWRNK